MELTPVETMDQDNAPTSSQKPRPLQKLNVQVNWRAVIAESVFIGRPAHVAERPVCDGSYDFCLPVLLKDLTAHDAYQAHEKHQKFIAAHKEQWEKIKVYDAD